MVFTANLIHIADDIEYICDGAKSHNIYKIKSGTYILV